MAGKKRKRKNMMTLLLLLASIAVLGIIYWRVAAANDAKEEEKARLEEEEAAADDTSKELLTLEKTTIARLSFTNPSYAMTLSRADAEGTWSDVADVDFPVNQTKANAILNTLTALKATQTVSEGGYTAAEYGLDAPQLTAELTTFDGTVYRVFLGDQARVGGYYARLEGDAALYLVAAAIGTNLSYTMQDMLEQESAPTINAANIERLTITSETFQSLELINDPSPEESYSGMALYTWQIGAPFEQPREIDATAINEYLSGFSSALKLSSAVDYREEALADYGLDVPAHTLHVRYNETQTVTADDTETGESVEETVLLPHDYTLFIGGQDGDGNYYVRQNDSSRVYLMTQANVETLIKTDLYTLLSKFLVLINIQTVSRIEVDTGETTHVYEMLYEETVNDAGETENTESGFVVDGVTVTDSESFRDFYTELISLKQTGFLPEDAVYGEEPLLTLRFVRTSEAYTEVYLELLPYTEEYAAARINGEAAFLVDQRDVNGYIAAIRSFIPE